MKRLVKWVVLFGLWLLAGSALAQNRNNADLRLSDRNFIRQPFWLSGTPTANGFYSPAVRWQKKFFQTESSVFRPERLVWTSGWNVYLLRGAIRPPAANNFALYLNGQAYNSFFNYKTVNWSLGPAVELSLGSQKRIYLLPTFGRFEGRRCKSISVGLRINF